MEKLDELKKQHKELSQAIKEEKRRIRTERKEREGNWFTRAMRAYELKRYRQLSIKYGELAISEDTEQYLNRSLDRIESALDQAMEAQCSPQVSH